MYFLLVFIAVCCGFLRERWLVVVVVSLVPFAGISLYQHQVTMAAVTWGLITGIGLVIAVGLRAMTKRGAWG
jgi:hypothetical protein